MKLSLAPIEQRPLVRPDFTSTKGLTALQWTTANRSALYDWFHATQSYADNDETWPIFCAFQFDQQVMLGQLEEELGCTAA